MFRTHRALGRFALVAALWGACAAFADAQSKGKSSSGSRNSSGSSATRSSAPRSSSSSAPRSSSAVRSNVPSTTQKAVTQSSQSKSAATVNSQGQSNQSNSVTKVNPQGKSSPSAVTRDGPSSVRPLSRDRDDDDRVRSSRYYDSRGHGHYRHHDRDDWWRYLAYSAAANWLGLPFGHYHYGWLPYAGYYGYYAQRPYYQDYFLDELPPASATAAATTIEVIVPEPGARVWLQGKETTSQGTRRRYESPLLDVGFTYSYYVKAAWGDDSGPQTVEREVWIEPGAFVTIDFTQAPPRISRR